MFTPIGRDIANENIYRLHRALLTIGGQYVITQRTITGVIYSETIGRASLYTNVARVIKTDITRDRRKFDLRVGEFVMFLGKEFVRRKRTGREMHNSTTNANVNQNTIVSTNTDSCPSPKRPRMETNQTPSQSLGNNNQTDGIESEEDETFRRGIFQPFKTIKHSAIKICSRGCKCYKRRTDIPDGCVEMFDGFVKVPFKIVGLGKLHRVAFPNVPTSDDTNVALLNMDGHELWVENSLLSDFEWTDQKFPYRDIFTGSATPPQLQAQANGDETLAPLSENVKRLIEGLCRHQIIPKDWNSEKMFALNEKELQQQFEATLASNSLRKPKDLFVKLEEQKSYDSKANFKKPIARKVFQYKQDKLYTRKEAQPKAIIPNQNDHFVPKESYTAPSNSIVFAPPFLIAFAHPNAFLANLAHTNQFLQLQMQAQPQQCVSNQPNPNETNPNTMVSPHSLPLSHTIRAFAPFVPEISLSISPTISVSKEERRKQMENTLPKFEENSLPPFSSFFSTSFARKDNNRPSSADLSLRTHFLSQQRKESSHQ